MLELGSVEGGGKKFSLFNIFPAADFSRILLSPSLSNEPMSTIMNL
jgi:hypothetical protein